MAGNGVCQAGAQHYKLLLALVFGRADGAAHGVVQTPELALGSGVHVAHAANHAVRLIVEIQRIGDQLVEIDVGRALETSPIATASTIVSTLGAAAAFPAIALGPRTSAFAAAAFPISSFLLMSFNLSKPHLLLLLFVFVGFLVNVPWTIRPFQRHAAGRPQLQVGRILADQVSDQTSTRLLKVARKGAAQNPQQTPMEAPGPFGTLAPRSFGLAVDAAQIPNILRRDAEL